MEEVQSLSKYLRLMIHFDPEALTGMQTAKALLQLLLNIVSGSRNLTAAADGCFTRVFQG